MQSPVLLPEVFMSSDNQLQLFEFDQPELETSSKTTSKDLIPTDVKIPIPKGIYNNLDELAGHCNNCQRCELSQTRHRAVVYRGNPSAKLMIVGEAPGQNEDETGLPFVGRAGQLLDKILDSVKFNREEDVYICNIIKCRPPNNRVPTPDEINACRPYLLEQIRIIDPKIILLAGATAVRGLVGDKRGITKIRGTWMEWEGRLCMPIFHPSYLLRNSTRDKGGPKWLMWQDIQEIRRKYDEICG